MALESIIQEFACILSKAFMQRGNESLLERVKAQVQKCFSRDPYQAS